MRTTGYVLTGPITIGWIPRLLAWPPSYVSAAKTFRLHSPSQCTASYVGDSELVPTLSRRIPAYTEASVEFWNSTQRRLNLPTRHAPPAASF